MRENLIPETIREVVIALLKSMISDYPHQLGFKSGGWLTIVSEGCGTVIISEDVVVREQETHLPHEIEGMQEQCLELIELMKEAPEKISGSKVRDENRTEEGGTVIRVEGLLISFVGFPTYQAEIFVTALAGILLNMTHEETDRLAHILYETSYNHELKP